MNKDILENHLLELPHEIAEESIKIVALMVDKAKADQKVDEIESAVKLKVGTDKTLTNDTLRKGAIKDQLAQNKDYEQYTITRDRVKNNLDMAIIVHQRKRDMFNALIAIAGTR